MIYLKKTIIIIGILFISYFVNLSDCPTLIGVLASYLTLINPYFIIPFFIFLFSNFSYSSLLTLLISLSFLFVNKSFKNFVIIISINIVTTSLFHFYFFQNYYVLISNILLGSIYTLGLIYVSSFNSKIIINNYPLFHSILLFGILIGSYNTIFFIPFLLLGIMLLQLIKRPYFSFMLSAISLFLTSINYLPIISLIYLFDYPLFIMVFIIGFNYYIKDYSFTLSLIISTLVFEIIKYVIKYVPYYKFEDEKLVSNSIVNNFNNHILGYATFIDDFKSRFLVSFESKKRFNEAFNNIINSFCFNCEKKNECFSKNRLEAYYFIKSSLIYGLDINTSRVKVELKDFIASCKCSKDLINKAHVLKNKYNLKGVRTSYEKVLSSGLQGISNTIRQYSLDLASKERIPNKLFENLHRVLLEHGYNISLFEIKSPNNDDLLIEIGIINIQINTIKGQINKIATRCLKKDVTLKIKKVSGCLTTFIITNKIKYRVTYGYSTVSKNNLNIAGDNYLIKPLDNGHFIGAISDGMGSGYKAFNESKLTLEMIDRMVSFDVSTNSTIGILNTFLNLKENTDQYATLDLVEISEVTGKATLYKLGGSNTYLYKDNKIKTIYNTNLPIGINDLTYETDIQLDYLDTIILVSDGITDSKFDIKKTILENIEKSPQVLSYSIIDNATRHFNASNDDMSVVVLKIEKAV